MSFQSRILIALAFIFFSTSALHSQEPLLRYLQAQPTRRMVCRQLARGASLDTVECGAGLTMLRIAPFKAFGVKGVLCMYYEGKQKAGCCWYLDSVASWVIPPKNIDLVSLAKFPGASGENWSHILDAMEKAYGSTVIQSESRILSTSWPNGVGADFGRSLRVIRVFSTSFAAAKVASPQSHFVPDRYSGLTKLDQTEKALADRVSIYDTILSLPSGVKIRAIEQYDSVWNIPGKSAYVLALDSRIISATWIPNPTYTSIGTMDRALATLKGLFGSPSLTKAIEIRWELPEKFVSLHRFGALYDITFARKDAHNIIDPPK